MCHVYSGENVCMWDFGGGNLKESEHLENIGVDGRIISL
jgi:hypothetical protein